MTDEVALAAHVAWASPDGRVEVGVPSGGGGAWLWRLGQGADVGTWRGEGPAVDAAGAALVAARAAVHDVPPRDPAQEVRHLEVADGTRWVVSSIATGGLDPVWAALVTAAESLRDVLFATAIPTAALHLVADEAALPDGPGLRIRCTVLGSEPVQLRVGAAHLALDDGLGWSTEGATTVGLVDGFMGSLDGVYAPANLEPDDPASITWTGSPGGGGAVHVEGSIALAGPRPPAGDPLVRFVARAR